MHQVEQQLKQNELRERQQAAEVEMGHEETVRALEIESQMEIDVIVQALCVARPRRG